MYDQRTCTDPACVDVLMERVWTPPSNIDENKTVELSDGTVVEEHQVVRNCSAGTFTCPNGYVCDAGAAIIGHAYGCVKPEEAGDIVHLTIHQHESVDLQSIAPNVSINIYNMAYKPAQEVQISVTVVGFCFYFAVDIPVTETQNRTGLTKLGQFFIDDDGSVSYTHLTLPTILLV